MVYPAFAASAPPAHQRRAARAPLVTRAPRSCAAAAPAPARRADNAPGNFYVTNTCIDCDTCRWLAPKTFGIAGPQSHVHTQPQDRDVQLRAQLALTACPTGSIRTETPHDLAKQARSAFPMPVSPNLVDTPVPDVFFNGYTAAASYGTASWLVLHRAPDQQFAVMFDVPRYDSLLEKNIRRIAAEVGGVKYLVLSHKDDVAHHEQWAEALGVQRIIHEKEVVVEQGTDAVEIKLSDAQLPYTIAEGLQLFHAPGHSPGSMLMMHHPSKSLFTGDHLMYMPREGGLTGSTQYCAQSWSLQIRNVATLAEMPFLHGWPGHTRHFHFTDAEDRRKGIRKAVELMSSLTCAMP